MLKHPFSDSGFVRFQKIFAGLVSRLFSGQRRVFFFLGLMLCCLYPVRVGATPTQPPSASPQNTASGKTQVPSAVVPEPAPLSSKGGVTAGEKVAHTDKAKEPAESLPLANKKPIWSVDFSGYVLAGYRMTLNDEKLLRLGDSDGFYINRARMSVHTRVWDFHAVISLDGAFDRRADPLDVSPATRRLFVELRDAYLGYVHNSGFYVTAGQDKVPFGIHSDRSTTAEHFINFPLIAVGEDISFGYQVRAIMPGRDIGVKLGFQRKFGLVGLHVAAMVFNGNGPNRFANDSDIPAVGARFRLDISQYFHIGGSFMWNQRRVGDQPNLFDESDLVFGADLSVRIAGFFLEGEFAGRQTTFITTQQASDFSFGFRADVGYRIRSIGLEFVVRVEMLDPSSLFDDDMLVYITPGINWYYRIWKQHEIAIRLNYTIKLEMAANRTLNNDQLNLLFQYRF